MIVKAVAILLITLALISCSSSRSNKASANRVDEQLSFSKREDVNNKIAFLTFEITMLDSASDSYQVKLIKSVFADGQLKSVKPETTQIFEPNYIYYQLSKKNQVAEGYDKVLNPLYMIYEYPADNGALNKTLIKKQKGEFVIRIQYQKEQDSISFYIPDIKTKSLKQIYHATL